MNIERLCLNNFRNFKNIIFEPNANINYIYGKNGVGKTNLVESISYLSIGKSYKNVSDKILMNKDSNHFYIKLEKDVNDIVEIGVDDKRKLKKHNGVEVKKSLDFVGIVKTIVFSAKDLDVVSGSPQEKRKFLDVFLSQIDKHYLYSLNNYKYLLEQKNKILKENSVDRNYLRILNEQLQEISTEIRTKRADFLAYVNQKLEETFMFLTTEEHKAEIIYQTNSQENINNYMEEEILKRFSIIGIHRDKFQINVDGYDANSYSSQGQKRLICLATKLIQNTYVQEKINTNPILILDDVFSELDNKKIDKLIEYLQSLENQIFITTTEKKLYPGITYFCLKNNNEIEKEDV